MFPLNRKVHMNSRQANLAQIPRDHYVSFLQVPLRLPHRFAPAYIYIPQWRKVLLGLSVLSKNTSQCRLHPRTRTPNA